MNLPFTAQEFFAVFAQYNRAVWPIPIILPLFALIGAIGVVLRSANWIRPVVVFAAALWVWMAVVYHWKFFRPLNPAAAGFAVLFGIQAVVLIITAWRREIEFPARLDMGGAAAIGLILYALILYPVIGYIVGHRYPSTPTFGLPCPTTLYTVGVLLWCRPLRVSLFIIPALWSLLGVSAALQLGVYEDLMLPVGGLGGIALALRAVLAARRGKEGSRTTAA